MPCRHSHFPPSASRCARLPQTRQTAGPLPRSSARRRDFASSSAQARRWSIEKLLSSIMANPTRPTRSSSVRLARDTPQARSTAKHDENSRNSTTNNNNHSVLSNGDSPVTTRRSSRLTPVSNLSHDEIAVAKSSPPPHPPPAQSSRRNPRKRPAAALSIDTPDEQHRPPTKLTVAQPHANLIQTTNGVQTVLPITDRVSSPGLATKQNGAPAGLKVPDAGTQGQDRRSLRSHDGGSRLKSDLSIYFANYEDIIGDVPKPREFLDIDTPIYLIDEPIKTTEPPPNHNHTSAPSSRLSASPNRTRRSRPLPSPPTQAPPPSSTAFHVLDYSIIAKHLKPSEEDPLADSVYFAPHRRAERKEKQLRNIEKERAMHEKAQLERLLDGLQGHDWLKVMGITGVTDGERRDWEPKRAYFIKEVQALVDKFRLWREEEKRLKTQRLHKQQRDAMSTETGSVGSSTARSPTMEHHPPHHHNHQNHRISSPQPRKTKRPPRPHGFVLPPAPPEPTTPFVSFYAKPHLRDAALGKHRHGRKVTAFGVPVPDFEEHEFALPRDYVTPDALRAHARKRRRLKRESAVGAK